VARIDVPRLNGLDVTFFNQIDFDTPLLAQFINRTPTFKAPNEASAFFHDSAVSITLLSQTAIYEIPYIQSVRTLARPMEKWHREHPMVGILTLIYSCKNSSYRRRIDKYHIDPARARGENDGSVAHFAEYQYQQDDM